MSVFCVVVVIFVLVASEFTNRVDGGDVSMIPDHLFLFFSPVLLSCSLFYLIC